MSSASAFRASASSSMDTADACVIMSICLQSADVNWPHSPAALHFVSFFVFYFNSSVKCPCNVIHDSVTLVFTFLIIIIIIIIKRSSASVRLSDVAYIGSNSKTKRPRKTKLCTGVPQVICYSHTDFKVKSQGGAGAYCGGDLAAQLVLESSVIDHTLLWSLLRSWMPSLSQLFYACCVTFTLFKYQAHWMFSLLLFHKDYFGWNVAYFWWRCL